MKILEENETTGSANIEINGSNIRIISVAEKGTVTKGLLLKFAERKLLPNEDELPGNLLEPLLRSINLNSPKNPVIFKPNEQKFQVVNTKDNAGKPIQIIEAYQRPKIMIEGKGYNLEIVTTSGKGTGSPKQAGF